MPTERKMIIEEFISQAKALLHGDISKAILYGSCARGDYRSNSDIDIMFLSPLSENEIYKVEKILYDLAYDFFMKYFIDISVIVKNEEHFFHWVNDLPFYYNVQKEGVLVYG